MTPSVATDDLEPASTPRAALVVLATPLVPSTPPVTGRPAPALDAAAQPASSTATPLLTLAPRAVTTPPATAPTTTLPGLSGGRVLVPDRTLVARVRALSSLPSASTFSTVAMPWLPESTELQSATLSPAPSLASALTTAATLSATRVAAAPSAMLSTKPLLLTTPSPATLSAPPTVHAGGEEEEFGDSTVAIVQHGTICRMGCYNHYIIYLHNL